MAVRIDLISDGLLAKEFLFYSHVRVSTLSLETLESIVMECPFINADMMRIVLILLKKVKEKFMTKSEMGTHMDLNAILRCIGEYPGSRGAKESRETSAIFLNSPHITHTPASGHGMAHAASDSSQFHQTLLQSFYGFDVGEGRENVQVIRKMSKKDSKNNSLFVSQLWCLLIGSNLLITFSDQSDEEVCGDSIIISPRISGNREPITIKLLDDNQCQHAIVIDPDYNYVDFLRHAVAVVKGAVRDAVEYELVGIDDEALTPIRWLDILRSQRSELYAFKLQRKPRQQLFESQSNRQRASSILGKHPSMQRIGKGKYLDATRLDNRREATRGMEQYLTSRSLRNGTVGESSLEGDGKNRLKWVSTEQFTHGVQTSNNSHLEGDANSTQLILSGVPRFTQRSDIASVESLRDRRQEHQSIKTDEYLRQNAGIVVSEVALQAQDPEVYDLSTVSEPLEESLYDTDSNSNDTVSLIQESFEQVHRPPPDRISPPTLSRRSTVHFETPDDRQERSSAIHDGAIPDVHANPLGLPRQPPSMTPFFIWQVTKKEDSVTAGSEESDKTAVKILSQLSRKLSEEDIGKLYLRTPKYWMDDLMRRHRLKGTSPGDNVTHTHDGLSTESISRSHDITTENKSESQFEGMGQASASDETLDGKRESEPTSQRGEWNGPKLGSETSLNDHESASIDMHTTDFLRNERALMIDLLEISQDILWAFTPKTRGPSIHDLCRRFWGCLDIIFRQMTWDEADNEAGDGVANKSKYTIRDFDEGSVEASQPDATPPALGKKWSKCLECTMGKDYYSATKALEHLHTEHISCSGKTHRPYEDPCFVWLDRMWETGPRRSGVAIMQAVEEFVTMLVPIRSMINELHVLVARAWDTRIDGGTSAPLPRLPRNLVDAFRKIVLMFILQSQSLSLQNRLSTTDDSLRAHRAQIRRKIERFDDLQQHARDKAISFLEAAKKDIILLGNTSRNIDNLDIEAVGTEFLVLALISASQNKLLMVETPALPPQKTSVIKLYFDYMSRLHFQANRRPKKRVFLDIHDFEEELDAFRKVVWAQTGLLGKYHLITCPNSFKVTSMTRVGQHPAETSYATSQQNRVDNLLDEIGTLKTKAKTLKEQVKQTIEIVEEDHGKAIRVFTIVTLFFLPLSFVSSFMGMNTTDIRNTNYSQRVFWMTSIPITLVVVVLALSYGYKGDEISDFLIQKMTDWKNAHTPRPRDTRGGNYTNGALGDESQRAATFITIGSVSSEHRPVLNKLSRGRAIRQEGMDVLESFREKRRRGKRAVTSWLRNAKEGLPK
ncbi:hypothetical protein PT974_09651 [Cladobotryum mycophilum]|uniref:Mg2+ transporter protein, CorA-like/Zinc transport protein ZntB n=1 Tax=Cladobotryum mycophilum TaxID=491253 RepID=A0ABR0SHY3_9HYPO